MKSKEWDRLGNICVARATTALEGSIDGYSKEQRDHMSDMFNSMAATNRTIRRVLEPGWEDPSSVDALVLARLQLECLFVLCLMFEDSKYVDCYTQDHWRKRYVQYLLMREETMALARFEHFVSQTPVDLIRLGLHFGVTGAQMQTVELEELGKPLPAGVVKQSIPQFPTPGKAIQKLPRGEKRRILERLYQEYAQLCSFAHGSGQANLLKIVFDKRSIDSKFLSDAEKAERFQGVVLGESYLVSFFSIVQSTTELTALYPGDMDLVSAAIEAWKRLCEASLLTKAVWEMRTRRLLGVIT
jgi:hypothetical protein